MITPLLRTALQPAVDRHRRLRLLNHLSLWWLVIAAAGAVLLVLGFGSDDRFGAAVWVVALAVTACVGFIVIRRHVRAWEPDLQEVARRIEQQHADLHAVLITAVEQSPNGPVQELNYLQLRVIAEAIRLARQHQWLGAIPRARWIGAIGFQVVAASALLLVLLTLDNPRGHRRLAAQAKAANEVQVTPGDVEIERGSGIVVLAKFDGDVPNEAALAIERANEAPQRLPLVKNLDDPVFGGGLPEVNGALTYRIEYAGTATRDFTVRVFEHPRLERADATLRFPEFTKLAEKKLPDVRRVSAVAGSTLSVTFHLNKPVRSANLVVKDGVAVPLAIHADESTAELRDFAVKTTATYELRLEDADGRASKVPATFAIEALSNRRPELKFASPKGDQRVSPIQEVAFKAEAWDDFGMARYGIAVNVAGRGEQTIELGREGAADVRQPLAHLLKLEELGVKPDELVSWFLWAEDAGPDGQPRRTTSDIFFAEVRPFEEIFRPGDDQEGGGGGGGSEATKLAVLQKQIITATWNLQRTEEAAAKSPSEGYLKDEPVVRDSQAEALNQATALGKDVEDAKSLALIENVTREMKSALEQLTAAAESREPLPGAIAAEQSAYNALLKLAAHEFRIVKNKGEGGGGGQQAMQQQLDQLEMKDEKQRYETKREATPAQNEAQREQLAVLNRLKELAQRQGDINERLKELQSALQEAKTEVAKEEIKRQLKRLREEEQQLLADLDETRQKMEQSPQQAQFADERRQLDEARAEAQQAAESMDKNAASSAVASGTRAARQLQEMRDDLRKKASGQFSEEMRQMRNEARALAEGQQAIAERLQEEAKKPARPTLEGKGEGEELAQQLEKQQGALAGLSEEMKRVSEQAEAAEPLLSKELYETLRKSAQSGTNETLRRTQLLAERGLKTQAQGFEEKARHEIEELKTGVERAAESVLGDEAEALRQARTEVDALATAIERELARARPELADASGTGKRDEASNSGAQKNTGEPGGQQPGGQQPGGQQPGGQQPGGQQPGGQQPGGQQSGGQQPGGQRATASNAGGSDGSDGGGYFTTQDRNANGAPDPERGPLTGDGFAEWSDRLRNVEEMIDDPRLRTEAARVREVAKGVRTEFKRHSVEPNWELVNAKIKAPLAELRDGLTEELARRGSKDNLIPIDRDPVPTKYAEQVRRYYEELGRSR